MSHKGTKAHSCRFCQDKSLVDIYKSKQEPYVKQEENEEDEGNDRFRWPTDDLLIRAHLLIDLFLSLRELEESEESDSETEESEDSDSETEESENSDSETEESEDSESDTEESEEGKRTALKSFEIQNLNPFGHLPCSFVS